MDLEMIELLRQFEAVIIEMQHSIVASLCIIDEQGGRSRKQTRQK